MLTVEEAKNFARFVALGHCQDKDKPKYLPKTELEAVQFEPDVWVIDAIRRASGINDPKCADNAS